MKTIFIDLLAFGTLLSSVLVITSKNPVVAVIFLISVFVNAAGYLILIGVGFLGITYIILYVGAITVLFLFVIMMINIKLTDILETGSQYTKNLPLALSVGSVFIYEIFTILPVTFNNVSIISALLDFLTKLNGLLVYSDKFSLVNKAFNPNFSDTAFIDFIQIQAIGQNLYTYGAIWLLLCSVILLLAMLAPIFISRSSSGANPPLRGRPLALSLSNLPIKIK